MSKPKVLAVISGKGGSGKTTVTVGIARYLASQGYKVALVDLDVKGPNLISKLTGGKIPELKIVNNRIVAYREGNLSAFSTEMYTDEGTGIALKSDDMKMFLRSIFVITDWGFEPDIYVCDTDPAASDTLDVLKSLFGKNVYVLVVSTPDQLSIDNTMRSIDVCRDRGLKIIGYVGNMAYYRCTVCGTKHNLFGNPEDLSVFSKKYGLKRIGLIEFYPNLKVSMSYKQTIKAIYDEIKRWL